jgi:glutamate racemase
MARIGIFDSGVGGLTVYQAIKATLPDANFYYCSDNEFHPYGTKADVAVAHRTLDVCSRFVMAAELDLLVIACNTASTVALGLLRSKLNLPIVGVVPAIKPAAEKSVSGVIGLLATPATIKRIYVDELIQRFAGDRHVIRVGSSRLVELAEEKARGSVVPVELVREEIKSLFVDFSRIEKSMRLDTVVLGCTHFPLLRDELLQASPWPVQWIDSGSAIAARVQNLASGLESKIGKSRDQGTAWVTRKDSSAAQLEPIMLRFGFRVLLELPRPDQLLD